MKASRFSDAQKAFILKQGALLSRSNNRGRNFTAKCLIGIGIVMGTSLALTVGLSGNVGLDPVTVEGGGVYLSIAGSANPDSCGSAARSGGQVIRINWLLFNVAGVFGHDLPPRLDFRRQTGSDNRLTPDGLFVGVAELLTLAVGSHC